MDRELEGKVALVTGGGNGIGQAAALAFAREGARVVVCDWDWHAGEETAARILRQGGDAQFVSADVSKESDIAKLMASVLRRYDRLDIAFNNAGISGAQGPIAGLSEADFSHVLAVNLTGVFLCMKHELMQMQKQGSGSIINNASILGTVGFAGAGAYPATKHGVLGLTKVAAIEYATQGIRVNAVCPGFIETPMLERAGLLSDATIRKSIEDLHAVKRLGTSAEVAEAVVFLASSRSSFITGHPLLVDGGFVSM
jgi:NAD(P)-dependent dehydrogenase (short-subunit alcohol dehydrogenase family)